MRVLLIGSGGREHAIAWALKRSPNLTDLYIAPGNAGTAELATNVALNLSDHEAVLTFCREKRIQLVMVGPEAPLVDGLADSLERGGILTFGPSKLAARLEGSKAFTKYICDTYNIPTAAYENFTEAEPAKAYIRKIGAPIVVKADGLAAGKGVVVAMTEAEAIAAIDDMLVAKSFGAAGAKVVVEEFLEGEEISFFALCDEITALPFGSAQDHKRVGEGDTGPNTGGMGTYSPAPAMTDDLHDEVMETIVAPLVHGMADEGCPFKGVLFAGLMLTKNGPKLLEINVRFGDPETQVLMARLETDLLSLLLAGAKGDLLGKEVELKDEAAVCVVMASNGYPGVYKKNTVINGLEEAASLPDTLIFHAGTLLGSGGEILANGGRVLGVTAFGRTVSEAQQKAYKAVDSIDWKEGFCRRDIGWRAIAREQKRAS